MQVLKGFTRQQITKTIIFLALFVITYGAVLGLYKIESNRGITDFSSPDPGANYVEVSINVVSIDPIKGDVAARIQFIPKGSFAAGDSLKPSQDIKFTVNTSTGKPERTFEKGKVMEPAEVVIPLFDGQVNDYPFDQHQSFLEVEMASATNPSTEIPLKVNFWSALPGFRTNATPNSENTNSYIGINITVARSISTILFSVFIMTGMLIIGMIVFIQSQMVRGKGKMVEPAMFAYMATLIFALPSVRNIQPGIPPVGTIGDFLAFFWAEGLATVSFITIAYCWLTRYGK